MESVVDILMSRDGMSRDVAEWAVENAKRRVRNGENPITILREDFGLEPDYLWDLV